MMPNVYKSKLDIKNVKSDFRPTFIQYDHAILEIELLDNGFPYNLSTANRVEFTHVREDGLVIIQEGEIVTDSDVKIIRYEYQGTEMDLLGTIKTSFAIFDVDNRKVSSHAFDVVVVRDLRDDIFNPAEPNFGKLQTLINDVEYLKLTGGVGDGTGVIPVPGPQGDPGYTPIKGVDYFDGKDGVDGKDGKSFTYADFTPEQLATLKGERGDMGEPGYSPQKNIDYFDGLDGKDGADGKSAYEIAVDNGFVGTEAEWLLSLKGERGEKGETGSGEGSGNGRDGIDGKSAYEIAVHNGFTGTESEWLVSLRGERGSKGEPGEPGAAFTYNDFTAAQLEALRGTQGEPGRAFTYSDFTPEQLALLKGERGLPGEPGYTPQKNIDYFDGVAGQDGIDGIDGKSAYQVAVSNGFVGTEAQWLASLKGETGPQGPTANIDTHLSDYMPHDSGLSQYSSSVDANGFYRVVEYKRSDNTLHLKSTASNPDTAGRYQTITWQFYAANGTTLALTKTWTITYDANGVIVSKVLS